VNSTRPVFGPRPLRSGPAQRPIWRSRPKPAGATRARAGTVTTRRLGTTISGGRNGARSSRRAPSIPRACVGQRGGGGGSPRWCSDDEVAVHSLVAAIHRRQAGTVVEGGGGRVLQHGKVEGRGETWQK
jgi:hypothetical protein